MTTNRISPSNLQDTLVLALANALPSPRASIGTDSMVQAVATQLGITLDEWGVVESQASKPTWVRYNSIRAFRFVKASGHGSSPQKGQYGLTQKGWERAVELGYTKNTAYRLVETPAVGTEQEEVAVAVAVATETHDVGVGVGLSSLLIEGLEDSYHTDPYITSLGIQTAKCFGFHTKNSPTCQGCPLARSCRSAWLQDLAEMARTLDETANLEATAPEEAEEEEVVEGETPATVEAAPQATNAPNTGTPVILPADSQCLKCGVTLTQGTEALVEWGSQGAFCKICP